MRVYKKQPCESPSEAGRGTDDDVRLTFELEYREQYDKYSARIVCARDHGFLPADGSIHLCPDGTCR
jgi:hypothetical protein